MNNTFPDGFHKDPYQAVDFSYFLSDQEKKEWYEWIPTASQESIEELVETLHEIWKENQKDAIPQGFANQQTQPITNNFGQSNQNPIPPTPISQTPTTPNSPIQPTIVPSSTQPLPIPPNDPFGQPIQPVVQPTASTQTFQNFGSQLPPEQPVPTQPQINISAVAQTASMPVTSPIPPNTTQSQVTTSSLTPQPTFSTTTPPTPNSTPTTPSITETKSIQSNNNQNKSVSEKIADQPKSEPKKSTQIDNSKNTNSAPKLTTGDSVSVTNKTKDTFTIGNQDLHDRQLMKNQLALMEKIIRSLSRLERNMEDLRLEQQKKEHQNAINGLSATTQKIHKDTATLSEMVNTLYDEMSILRTMVQNQQDQIRVITSHIQKLCANSFSSSQEELEVVKNRNNTNTSVKDQDDTKINRNRTSNPFGNPFK